MASRVFFADGYLTTLPIAQFTLAYRQVIGSIERDVEIWVVEMPLETLRKTSTFEQQVRGGLQIRSGRVTLHDWLTRSMHHRGNCAFQWTHSFCLRRIPTAGCVCIYV